MKTILAPVDFSPATATVVAQATALARLLPARLVLLSVVQAPVIVSEFTPMMGNTAEFVDAAQQSSAERLQKLQRELPTDLLAVVTETVTGLAAEAIADAARRFAADYIVMGSHGHTAFYDLVIGSTTHGVIQRAKCPVVIVPAQ
jgi:nucleotide-binding universal stress UspA family protein